MLKYLRFLMSLALALGLANQALAHANLKSTEPADKASVSSPEALNLTFSETPNLKLSHVKLFGPQQEPVETGDPMLMDGDKTIMVPVSNQLEPGLYSVKWDVLSVDGHKLKGTYSFTVTP